MTPESECLTGIRCGKRTVRPAEQRADEVLVGFLAELPSEHPGGGFVGVRRVRLWFLQHVQFPAPRQQVGGAELLDGERRAAERAVRVDEQFGAPGFDDFIVQFEVGDEFVNWIRTSQSLWAPLQQVAIDASASNHAAGFVVGFEDDVVRFPLLRDRGRARGR